MAEEKTWVSTTFLNLVCSLPLGRSTRRSATYGRSRKLTELQAKTYILDPLTEPEPSAAMGPGTSLATTNIPTAANPISAPMGQSTNSASRNDYNAPLADGPRPVTTAQIREASQREAHQNKDGTRHTVIEMSKNQPSVSVREQGINKSNNPFRQANSPGADTKHAASSHVRRVSRENAGPVYASPPRHHSEASHSQAGASHSGHRRQSSLTPRFPGDHSDHPLDVLREENREANHAPHLQKRHLPGADLIDRLDDSGFQYHHDGPFDAALLARNTSYQSSPVAALSTTNQEAINATPKEKIKEAVNLHRPMDGTAFVPPGYEDAQGRTMHYEEGEDMMIEHGGNFKRYDGIVSTLRRYVKASR